MKINAIALLCVLAAPVTAQVRVINMIPPWFGDENVANPEPTLAVNPKNPALLAASSFVLGTEVCAGSDISPILVSRDSGQTWSVACKFSTPNITRFPPADVVLRWSPTGDRLYGVMLWPFAGGSWTLRVVATDDLFSPDTMQLLTMVPKVDQPDLAVLRVGSKDRLLVAGSFKSMEPRAAAILAADDPTPNGRFITVPLEGYQRTEGNYAARLAAHPSGRVYGFYNSVARQDSVSEFDDFVVVRDDNNGISVHSFSNLSGKADTGAVGKCPGKPQIVGVRVARCRPEPYDQGTAAFGFQRRIPVNLSIAVDHTEPTGSRVYVAWADSSANDLLHLWVARSDDAGRNWMTILSIPNATNPSLAINDSGHVGFLFQQLGMDTDRVSKRWITRLLLGKRGFVDARSFVLANTPANGLLNHGQPYIGDFIELHAAGTTWMGVFSASNVPDSANFPNGVEFQRRHSFGTKLLLKRRPPAGGEVTIDAVIGGSIDPYFFSIGPVQAAECARLRSRRPPSAAHVDPGMVPGRIANPIARRMAQIGCKP